MLVHIGYHKTGSTWLQEAYFPRHAGISLAGTSGGLLPAIVFPHDFDFSPEQARGRFQPAIDEAAHRGLTPVFSSERLSGNPHSGGYDSVRIAHRLLEVFPEAQIVMVVREQASAIDSTYRQYVKRGGVCKLADYLDPPRDGRMPLFRLDHFRYDRLAALYSELFGRGQVHVLVFEELRQDPERFIDRLNTIVGSDPGTQFRSDRRVNEARNELSVRTRRMINRFHGGDSLFPPRPPLPGITGPLLKAVDVCGRVRSDRGSSRFGREIDGRIDGVFEASNRHLDTMFDLGLAAYGYRL